MAWKSKAEKYEPKATGCGKEEGRGGLPSTVATEAHPFQMGYLEWGSGRASMNPGAKESEMPV